MTASLRTPSIIGEATYHREVWVELERVCPDATWRTLERSARTRETIFPVHCHRCSRLEVLHFTDDDIEDRMQGSPRRFARDLAFSFDLKHACPCRELHREVAQKMARLPVTLTAFEYAEAQAVAWMEIAARHR